MFNSRMPGWFGWPSSEPVPGSTWTPGPILNYTVIALLSIFLSLGLTVGYTYSIAFFLLAIIGFYIGLRRGFLNGLTRHEKLLLLVFSAYPVIAIVSYVFGHQTVVGFHLLGRELRFFLFIPIYLTLRWTKLSRRTILLASTIGLVIAIASAAIAWHATPNDILIAGGGAPKGATGTHITFGDMGLAIALMASGASLTQKSKLDLFLIFTCVGLGIVLAILALARGAWITLPYVLIIIPLLIVRNYKDSLNYKLILVSLFILICLFIFVGKIAATRTYFTVKHVSHIARSTTPTYDWSSCPNSKDFLTNYSHVIFYPTGGTPSLPLIQKVETLPRSWLRLCTSRYAIVIHAKQSKKPLIVDLPRMGFQGKRQFFSILAKGAGKLLLWNPESVKNFSSTGFRLVTATSLNKSAGTPATIIIPPGGAVKFIPLQFPYSYDGYSLILKTGSIADRISMWSFAWNLFIRHPVLGVGLGAFRSEAENASLNNVVDAIIARAFEHPHSIYLNSLSSGGILLFLSLIALLLFPSVSGGQAHLLLLAIPFLLFGLTESIFVHSFVISTYVVLTAILVALHTNRLTM